MFFKKTPKNLDECLTRSTRRISAARRAVQRQKDKYALVPELVTSQTAEERLDKREATIIAWNKERRHQLAVDWIRARRMLRELPEPKRKSALAYWQRKIYPGHPGYLICLISNILDGSFDPEEEKKQLEKIAEIGRQWREKHHEPRL